MVVVPVVLLVELGPVAADRRVDLLYFVQAEAVHDVVDVRGQVLHCTVERGHYQSGEVVIDESVGQVERQVFLDLIDQIKSQYFSEELFGV